MAKFQNKKEDQTDSVELNNPHDKWFKVSLALSAQNRSNDFDFIAF